MNNFSNIFFIDALSSSFFLPMMGILLLIFSHNVSFVQNIIAIIIPYFFILSNLAFYFDKNHEVIEKTIFRFNDIFEIKFLYTEISNIFLLMVGCLWLLNNIYSIGYIKIREIRYTYFMSFIFLFIVITTLIASSGNLITLFFFYEVLTLSTYFLVSYHKENYEVKIASAQYLKVLMLTSACFFLFAIAICFVETSSFVFLKEGIMEFYRFSNWWMIPFLLILFLYGASKAATLPFHFWLPEAMIAEIPVSALLHAVAIVKSGIITLLYIVSYYFGIKYLAKQSQIHPVAFSIPKYIAGISAIYASVFAIKKSEIKKVLAYSTMGQLGYMTMLIFSFHEGMEGVVLLQLIAHAIAKINLFFCAGIFYLKYKIKKISDLNSIAKKEFILCLCFAISALSIIGLPPTIGFMAKLNMLIYAVKNEEFFITSILVFGTILNCYYFLPMISKMFFEKRDEKESENGDLIEYDSHFTLYIPIYISTIAVILFFCFLI
jgi:multicomponent Na+:H+ antiporter subunit D